MKERIFLCLLLATVSLLCSCSEQRYVPDSISSHAEITAKPRTTQPEKSTTLPRPEPQEKELTMIVNGMALDVSWEDNETVEELLVYAQNGTITVNTTIYGGFEQVGSLPQSFSRNDVQMTTEPGDIVLYSGNQLVVFFPQTLGTTPNWGILTWLRRNWRDCWAVTQRLLKSNTNNRAERTQGVR